MNESLRSNELTKIAHDFLNYKTDYLSKRSEESIINNRTKILKYFNANQKQWNSWEWQARNSISSINTINQIFNLKYKINTKSIWSITPYFLSLVQELNYNDPIFSQMIPNPYEETDSWGTLDPMCEKHTQPVNRITRRYPDRVILNVTNLCFSYCRHCQRKRNISCIHDTISESELNNAYLYINEHKEIRDVLITGGDPLTYSDKKLENIIKKIRDIPHVEIIRIGTRAISTMPQRITEEFTNMIKEYAPIYIITQFNHPNEITIDTQRASALLSDNGIILGNQSVLLNGINDNSFILQLLNQMLLKLRIRPYYIFHPKTVSGTHHFYVSINRGIEIVNGLRGNTSGLCVPTYVYNSQGGNGKIVLNKNSLCTKNNRLYVITWENKLIPVNEDYEV